MLSHRLCKCKEEQRKAFPRPSPLPNRFHQRRLLEGVPGGEATASTAHASKEVKCLQSELNFTPDGPWWSQRGGGKCLPYALLREGFKWKPQSPAPSNPRLVWRSHVPSCLLGPFSSSVGLRPRDSDALKTKLSLLPTSPSNSWLRLNFGHWQVLQNTRSFPSSSPEMKRTFFSIVKTLP